MSNAPSYFEIGVPDGANARAFYSRVLPGWSIHPMGEGDQGWIQTPGLRGGLHDQDAEARIELFFEVDDIEAAVRAVRDAGGQAEEPSPVEEGFGRFAACHDDQKVRFGLHQPELSGPSARIHVGDTRHFTPRSVSADEGEMS